MRIRNTAYDKGDMQGRGTGRIHFFVRDTVSSCRDIYS